MVEAPSLSEDAGNFLAHWQGLAAVESAYVKVPTLSAFLDKPLPKLQPHVIIVDVHPDSSWSMRLMGTAVVNFFGADFRGRSCADMIAVDPRQILIRSQREIIERPCANLQLSHCAVSSGRQCRVVSLGLPLRRANGNSVVWLMEIEVPLMGSEVGLPVREIVAETWIDLGNGVPDTAVLLRCGDESLIQPAKPGLHNPG